MQISPLGSNFSVTGKSFQPLLTFNGGASSFDNAAKHIRQGDLTSIRELPDVFLFNKQLQSLLHIAGKEDKPTISQYLIKEGLSLNQADEKGETPTFLVKTAEMLRLFIENNANINFKNKFGKTPIFKYTIQNNYELLEEALKNGADANIIDANKKSVIMYTKDLKTRKLLLDYSASPNVKYPDGYSLIHKAIIDNDEEFVKLLLEYKPNLSIKDLKGYRPLFYAKNPKLREFLLKKGANPNEDFYLQYALLLRDTTALKQFLNHGSNPNKVAPNGRTPVFFATTPEQLEILAKHEAILNYQDPNGNTALHQFSLLGQKQLIAKLKELGADDTIRNKKGELPIDLLKRWEKYNFWIK